MLKTLFPASQMSRCLRNFSLFSRPPEIIFEDQDFFFVSKPSGISTLGVRSMRGIQLGDDFDQSDHQISFLEIVRQLGLNAFRFAPDAVLPLDRVSSGLMAFAKHDAAQRHLRQLAKNCDTSLEARLAIIRAKGEDKTPSSNIYQRAALPTISQTHLAWVRGAPPKARGKLDHGVIRRTSTNRFMMVPRGGVATRTNYAVIANGVRLPSLERVWKLPPPTRATERGPDGKPVKSPPANSADEQTLTRELSLIAFRSSTHTRHQVRAACSWLGTPIVGDRDYGGGEAPTVLLHTALVEFPSMNGQHKYSICCAPPWKSQSSFGSDMPDLTSLVSSLGDPEAGSLRDIYQQIVSGKSSVEVSSNTAAGTDENALKSAQSLPPPPKINPSRLQSSTDHMSALNVTGKPFQESTKPSVQVSRSSSSSENRS